MSKKFRRTPSPALVVAIVALVLAASGTAVAASKLVSGNSLIKVNSLSGNRLKNGSVTGKQIAVKTLGKVPSAATADTATSATTATTAGSAPISNVTYVTANGSAPFNGGSAPYPLTATCPSGTTVIGGGGSVADETLGYLNDSYPTGKTGWTADFFNEDVNNQSSLPVTVTAICAPAAATTGS